MAGQNDLKGPVQDKASCCSVMCGSTAAGLRLAPVFIAATPRVAQDVAVPKPLLCLTARPALAATVAALPAELLQLGSGCSTRKLPREDLFLWEAACPTRARSHRALPASTPPSPPTQHCGQRRCLLSEMQIGIWHSVRQQLRACAVILTYFFPLLEEIKHCF